MLQVGAFPFPSDQGSQVLLAGTSRALIEAGHHVEIAVYGHGTGRISGGGIEPIGGGQTCPVHRARGVPGYRRMRSGPDLVKPVLDLGLARTVARVIRDRPFDVVHAHNHEALLACVIARRLSKSAPQPLGPDISVSQFTEGKLRQQEARAHPDRGHLPALVYGQHTLMAEELPTYARLPGLGSLGRVLDGLPRFADAAIALCERGASALAGLRRVGGALPIAVIPPGIFAADFEQIRPHVAGDGRWLVYAGTPDAFQGLDHLATAMLALPDWRLLLVGPAWTEEAARRISPRARAVPVPWREARNWIAGANVAVVPRATCAGFSIKLLNYAALGLRTVVLPGAARGVPGEVAVAQGESIAAAVRRAACLPAICRSDVLRDWGWPARVPQLLDVYEAARVTPRAA